MDRREVAGRADLDRQAGWVDAQTGVPSATPEDELVCIAEVHELRQRYWGNGFRVVALRNRSKAPVGQDWVNKALRNPPAAVTEQPDPNALGTGILCGDVAALDIDIFNQAVVDQLIHFTETLIGISPLARIGQAPKTMLLYRAGFDFGRLLTPEYVLDGRKAQTELRGAGHHVVADGIHPDTGKPFVWLNGTPANTRFADLPEITEAQVNAILAEAERLIRAAGGVSKRPPASQSQSAKSGYGAMRRAGHDKHSLDDGFFSKVNTAALADLGAWVPTLYPSAKYQPGTRAYRVAAKDRGRPDLQEDVSFHPEGIRDFGEEHPVSAIDAVIHRLGLVPLDAALWLCDRIGIAPATLGFGPPHPKPQPQPTASPASEVGLPPLLTARAFMATFRSPDYIIDGIIQRGRLYALTSPTAHGKTAVCLYSGCMVAAARNIGNIEVVQGPVVFLAGENPDDLCCRFHAACQFYRLNPDTLPIHFMPGNFPITAEAAEALKQRINATGIRPALIIPDTAAAYFQGDDDNDNVQKGAFARNLRVLTTCDGYPAVLTPAHPVKHADKDNLIPAGGGAFMNELDGNLTLWSEVLGETATLHWHGKLRGPDFAPVNFALPQVKIDGLTDKRGRPIVSIVATLQTDEQAEKAAKAAISEENTVLEWLRRHPGISVRDIASNAGWLTPGGQPNVWKVLRLLKSLKRDRLVQHRRRKWRITADGKSELEPK
jgi:hypothetical protein